MRGTLADPSLARYAGQVVWLALDFDRPENEGFLARHATSYTPTFYMIDPATDRAIETQLGAMTVDGVAAFIDRGTTTQSSPAGVALARGDQRLASDQAADAIGDYREALQLGGAAWAERDRALGSLVATLQLTNHRQDCAETAATVAPGMGRGEGFGRVVSFGLGCVVQEPDATWAAAARRTLEPLAAEAIEAPTTARDHRFLLFRWSIILAEHAGDHATAKRWGDRWLGELDATTPATDDERTALDISRVEAADALSDPARVLPALIASEKAMPASYVASLRLAQVDNDAKRYDDAIAACERGLAHVTGPLGRSWLFQTEAAAYTATGRTADARRVLEQALVAAKQIPVASSRERNIAKITGLLR